MRVYSVILYPCARDNETATLEKHSAAAMQCTRALGMAAPSLTINAITVFAANLGVFLVKKS